MTGAGNDLRAERITPQLGSLFAWLLRCGVTSQRLAGLFGTTAVNIRVAASRSRAVRIEQPAEKTLADIVPCEERQGLGIRPEPDEVLDSAQRRARLKDLAERIELAAEEGRRRYAYEDAITALRRQLPYFGCPSDSRRIALLARLEYHLAWFNTHLGHSATAIRHGRRSMGLWRTAYGETAARAVAHGYASAFVESALVVSHTYLLTARPAQALDVLALAEAAAAHIHQPLGSDFFRQRGVAAFQLGDDTRSKEAFEQAERTMLERSEARNLASPAMTGRRHLGLLSAKTGWEDMLEIRALAARHYGTSALEYSVITNWCSATGLATDSSALHAGALQILQTNAELARQFGHQHTVTRLLMIADELGLYPALRRKFIRRALYENAARNS